MKFIKTSIVASLVLSGMAFTACSDDNEYVMPENVKGVYFTTNDLAIVKVDPEETGFTVEVGRNGLTEAATYNLVTTLDRRGQGKFTVPSTVTFAEGATTATFNVACDLASTDLGRSFPISIAFAEGTSIYPWGAETYDFNVTCDALDDSKYWKKYGTAQIIDGWIAPFWVFMTDDDKVISLSALRWKVDCEESIETPGVYRLVNPWLSDDCYLISRDMNLNTEPTSVIIDATNEACVKIIPQYSGATVNISEEGENVKEVWICNEAGYMSEIEGKSDEEIIAAGKATTIKRGYFTVRPALYGFDGVYNLQHEANQQAAIQLTKAK